MKYFCAHCDLEITGKGSAVHVQESRAWDIYACERDSESEYISQVERNERLIIEAKERAKDARRLVKKLKEENERLTNETQE